MRSRALGQSLFADAKLKQMEVTMAHDRTNEKERPDESQPGRRIVEVEYEEITRVIEFKIFVVQPDGTKARMLGGGAFEEQDLDRVAEELVKRADDSAFHAVQVEGFLQGIEESEGEDV